MRAVRSIAGLPTVVDVDEPSGDWPLLEGRRRRYLRQRSGAAFVGASGDDRALPSLPVMMKELTLTGCMCYDSGRTGHEFAQAADVLAANPDIAATVVTHRFPLADAAEAFRVAADRTTGAIKVVLHP